MMPSLTMAASKVTSLTSRLEESALEDSARRVSFPLATPSTSPSTPLKSQPHPLRVMFPRLSSWRNPLFDATRLPGQSKFCDLEQSAQRSAPVAFSDTCRKAAMIEYGKSLVGQLDNQELLHELPLEDTMDVDMGKDSEMTTSPGTPRAGSTSNAGLLTPQSAADSIRRLHPGPYPFLRNDIQVAQEPSSVPTPVMDPPTSPLSISSTETPGTMLPPRVSRPATNEEILSAPDYMMPLPDPYYPNREMISRTEVGNATNALFAHMKARFNPTLEANRNVSNTADGRVSPIPMPDANRQTSLPHRPIEGRRLPPPQFQTPGHVSIRKQHYTWSLSDILTVERQCQVLQARELDGISFHHVVQQPFANELRAHYAADDKSCQEGRAILMYKVQLAVPDNPRLNSYERHTEMWHFFEIRTALAPNQYTHSGYAESSTLGESSVILALPSSDMEENKSEECPMSKGAGQIIARRREYTIKPNGRFRLETQNVLPENQTWNSIRQDLTGGSCRLFTWTEV